MMRGNATTSHGKQSLTRNMKRRAVIRVPHWYRIASIVWLLVVAVQWIDFTEPFWLHQTSMLVLCVLIAVALCEMLLHSLPWLNWMLKIVSLIVLMRIILGIYVYEPAGSWYPDQTKQLLAHASPYIWFAIFSWGLFDLLHRLLNDRVSVLLFFGTQILAFTILDSFTPYQLWSNVAWIVFAGLGWLACLHFLRFQQKYPHGWSNLRKEPLKVTLNIAVIFACVLLIGISMPSVSPTLVDPYSLWVKRTGASEAEVSVFIPLEQSLPQLNSSEREPVESGYSRNDEVLGGGFEFSFAPVMNISSSVRSYWRGETRREYTGSGWSSLEQEGRNVEVISEPLTKKVLVNTGAGRVETKLVEQIVTMESDENYPVLFGGYSIKSIEILDEDADRNPLIYWASKEAEAHWDGFWDHGQTVSFSNTYEERRQYPRRYKLQVEMPIIPLEELRQASYETLFSSSEIDQSYLQIPADFPDRVKRLALDVTAKGNTPYQKMELLQQYLRDNFVYTNRPDISRATGQDFVENFLFDIQEGYCDYYSTAMVMMARSLDIPARWVKGYAPGYLPSIETLRQFPEMAEVYQVSNADAHSWAELYFGEEYGWIPFEATPGFHSTLLTPEEDLVTELDEELDTEYEITGEQANETAAFDPVVMRWVFGISSTVLILFVLYFFRSELYYALMHMRIGRAPTYDERIVFEVQQAVRSLRRQGLQRAKHETMREAIQRWVSSQQPDCSEAVLYLLAVFEQAIYSPQTMTREDWLEVRDRVRRLLKELCRQEARRLLAKLKRS